MLMLLVEQARRNAISREFLGEPQPGDLVVEVSKFSIDPDAIGWLLGTGEAPYNDDGTGPTRIVSDIVPLSGAAGLKGRPYQRWENAEFVKVQTRLQIKTPPEVLELVEQYREVINS